MSAWPDDYWNEYTREPDERPTLTCSDCKYTTRDPRSLSQHRESKHVSAALDAGKEAK